MHREWLLATARRRPYSPRPPPTENPPCALFITSPCCSPPSAARLHRHPTPPPRPSRRSTPPTQIGLGSPPPATPIPSRDCITRTACFCRPTLLPCTAARRSGPSRLL